MTVFCCNSEFTLPQGATIKVNTPITGDTESTYDFSEEPHSRKFTVTSEDGQWQPVYTVNVILAELPTLFSFERSAPLFTYTLITLESASIFANCTSSPEQTKIRIYTSTRSYN